jgi:hypothetical protein
LNNIAAKLKQEIITLLHTMLKQNYFQFANNFCKPEKGVLMRSPVPGIVAEIFLQHCETYVSN